MPRLSNILIVWCFEIHHAHSTCAGSSHYVSSLSLSLSSSLEIILRAEAVEMVQAGDKCDFIGTLIAIPDVAQLAMESEW